MRSFMNSFYSKLAMAIVASFVLLGMLMLMLAQQLTHTYQQEIEQKLHLDLAKHVADDDQLLKDGEIDQVALKHAFHSMMILGPGFEFYILDPKGTVTTYSADPDKIKRRKVSLGPIRELLSGESMLPIPGDDPRSVDQQKIFSVAEIRHGDVLKGYLYIIIGGEIYDNIADLLQKSHIVKFSFWGMLAVLVFSAIVILLVFALLTRPLRHLTRDIQLFQRQGFAQGSPEFPQSHAKKGDEIHRLRSAFSELVNTLHQQYQKVKNTDELRRELISYVSHDVRTPLASLQGYLETWQLKHDSLSDEENAQLIQTASNNAAEIGQLIEQLFELASLDGDDVLLNKEPLAIAELIDNLIRKRSLDIEEKQLQLDITPKNSALRVMADIEKLERVLTNLLDNAIRHCDDKDRISFELVEHATAIEIRVTDSGMGIPPEDLAHIFEPHFRATNSAKGKTRNSGLGLAISQRIIKLHNGDKGDTISVESQLGSGSTFSFKLAKP